MFKKIKNWFYVVEKLSIKLDYNKETGLSLKEFSDYLLGISNAYSSFTNKKSELNIKNVSKGSVIIEFTEQIVLPVLVGTYSNGLYDFGKMLINSVRSAKNTEEILSKIELKDTQAIKNAETALIAGGINNTGAKIEHQTINYINITVSTDNGNDNETIISEDKKKLSRLSPILDNITEDILQDKKKIKKFESVILKFKTVTVPNTDKVSYTGWIESIHKDPKKVDFVNDEIKDTFPFNNFDFNKEYLVSVDTYYNSNGTIAKYCIIENLGEN
jgi:hypothetical protein